MEAGIVIKYYQRQVYGKTRLYLVENEYSHAILSLIGAKTISKVQMDLLKFVGVQFLQVFDPSL